jgi:hypothetical protein
VLGHLILVRSAEHVDHLGMLAALGFRAPIHVEPAVAGARVVEFARRLVDEHQTPASAFAITAQREWTLVSDLSGALLDELDALADLSARLDARVLALCFEPDACSLCCFEAGRLRRRVEQGPDGLRVEGEPLAIEAAFGSPARLEEDDLLVLAQSLGLDLQHLNDSAVYTLVAFATWPGAA